MKRKLFMGHSQSNSDEETPALDLCVSSRYRGYLFERGQNTFYRILDGNSADCGFPTDETVLQLKAAEPCRATPVRGETWLQLHYKLSLHGCRPDTVNAIMRSRMRCLKASSRVFHRRFGLCHNSLVCPDKRGIVSLSNKQRCTAIGHQDIIKRPHGSLEFGPLLPVLVTDVVSEMVWKSGAPVESNELVLLCNAPFAQPEIGVGVSILRLGNKADISASRVFEHRMKLRGYVQGLNWCPQRDLVIFGTENKSVALDVTTKKTYQINCGRSHAHLFHEDMLYCGGHREVQNFDLRESLRQSCQRFHLGDSAVAKRLLFLPRRNRLLVGCATGKVTQWDLRRTTSPVATYDNCQGYSLQCSPLYVDEAERFLVCVDLRHGTHIWDLDAGHLLRCLPDEHTGVYSATFMENDRILCTFSETGITTYVI